MFNFMRNALLLSKLPKTSCYLRFCPLLLLTLLASCSDDDSASVRLINTSPDAPPLELVLDDDSLVRGLTYSNGTEFMGISTEDEEPIRVRLNAAGVSTALVDEDVNFRTDSQYSMYAIGYVDDIQLVVEEDDLTQPSSGEFRLRIANLIPNARRDEDEAEEDEDLNEIISSDVDVYITFPNASLEDSIPSLSNLQNLRFSSYFDIRQGGYRIRFTLADTLVVVYDTGPLTFREGEVATLSLLLSEGGELPLRSILSDDRG